MFNLGTATEPLKREPPPVLTFGLVVYHQNPGEEPVFHISQRRDSLAYIHFIRGKVPDDKLELYFTRMTAEEKKRIQSNFFEDLWFDLFSDTSRKKTEQFRKARDRFEQCRGILEEIYKKTQNQSIVLEWGLPKGRKKHQQEPDLVCAQREYREETRNKCYLEFLDYPPIECKHHIRNEKVIYYIARSKFRPRPKRYTLNFGNIYRDSISEETGDLRWLTLFEALKLVPPMYQRVLQEVSSVLKHDITSFLVLQDAITKYGNQERSGDDSTNGDNGTESDGEWCDPVDQEVEKK